MKRLGLVLVVLFDLALALPAARALDTQLEARDETQRAVQQRMVARTHSSAAPSQERHVDAAALRIGVSRPSPLRGLTMHDRAGTRRAEAAASNPLLHEPSEDHSVRRPRIVPYAAVCTQGGANRAGRIHSMERCAVAGDEARPFMPHLFTSMHAETFPLEHVGVWGGQQKFRTLRGSIAVGIEAGAAIRIRENANLTAGFRLLGYGSGENGPLQGGSLDPSLTAPFLGLSVYY